MTRDETRDEELRSLRDLASQRSSRRIILQELGLSHLLDTLGHNGARAILDLLGYDDQTSLSVPEEGDKSSLMVRVRRAIDAAKSVNFKARKVFLTDEDAEELQSLLPAAPFVKYAPKCVRNLFGLDVVYGAEYFRVE